MAGCAGHLGGARLQHRNLAFVLAVKFVFAAGRDITELHRAAEALANREAELRAIVDGVEDLLMLFDAQGRIAFVNPAFARTVGYPAEDFIHRAPADLLVDPVARAAFSGALHRVLRDGRAETLEFEYQRASEPSARYYVTRFTPLLNSHGQVTTSPKDMKE